MATGRERGLRRIVHRAISPRTRALWIALDVLTSITDASSRSSATRPRKTNDQGRPENDRAVRTGSDDRIAHRPYEGLEIHCPVHVASSVISSPGSHTVSSRPPRTLPPIAAGAVRAGGRPCPKE